MLSIQVQQLVKLSQAKGIKFYWVTPEKMDSIGKGSPMGVYNKLTKCVCVRKGMTKEQAEETIVHEIAHALWDLSLKSSKLKRSSLKKLKVSTSLPTWINLLINYHKDSWQEERFCYHFEKRPNELMALLKQL